MRSPVVLPGAPQGSWTPWLQEHESADEEISVLCFDDSSLANQRHVSSQIVEMSMVEVEDGGRGLFAWRSPSRQGLRRRARMPTLPSTSASQVPLAEAIVTRYRDA